MSNHQRNDPPGNILGGTQPPNPMPDLELYKALGRLEAKMDLLIAAATPIEQRIGALERWRSFLVGAWTVLAGFFLWMAKGEW